MREITIPQNWTDIVQRSSQSGAPENINLKDTWFTTYLEEYHIKTPNQDPRVTQDNNNKNLTSLQYEPHVQEIPTRERASVSEVN